jgi:hypothetical protein
MMSRRASYLLAEACSQCVMASPGLQRVNSGMTLAIAWHAAWRPIRRYSCHATASPLVYVCVYVCMYACMRMHRSMRGNSCHATVSPLVYVCVCMCVCVCKYRPVRVYSCTTQGPLLCVCVYVYVYICVRICTCACGIYTHTQKHTHTIVHTY